MNENQKEALKQANKESNALTKESIREALMLLLDKNEFKKIKITDVIRKSGVSRSAFYKNYKSLEDVLLEIIDIPLEKFALVETSTLEYNWENIFLLVEENRKNMKILIDAGLEYILLKRMNEFIENSVSTDTSIIIVQAWNGIVCNIIIEWIKNDSKADYLLMAKLTNSAIKLMAGQILEN